MSKTKSGMFCKAIFIIMVLIMVQGVGASDNRTVEATDYNKVVARIYDAATLTPIASAKISIYEDGQFFDSGKGTAITDSNGYYECDAKIGRVSGHTDLSNAAVLNLMNAKTRRIDVSRLTLRVQCPGYKTFEGVVQCDAVLVDDLKVYLCPVFLVKSESPEISFTAQGWGRIEVVSSKLDPPVTHRGWKPRLTVKLKCPSTDLKPVLVLYSGLCATKMFSKFTVDADGLYVFDERIAVPKSGDGIDIMPIRIENTPYELKSSPKTTLMLQSFSKAKQENSAKLRQEAYEFKKKYQYSEASAKLTELCADPMVTPFDKLDLFSVSRKASLQNQTNANKEKLDVEALRANIAADKDNRDFSSRHEYALAMTRKVVSEWQSKSASIATVEECEDALAGALVCGRSPVVKKFSPTMLGLLRKTNYSVAGFYIPEAEADFVIRQYISTLASDKVDPLSLLNLAQAFFEVGEYSSTLLTAEKCLEARPDCNDASYYKALAEIQLGNGRKGVKLLEEVVKANPRHYMANLILSNAYSAAGETEKANTYLSAHESFYGHDAKELLCSIKLPLQGIDLAEKKPDTLPVVEAEKPVVTLISAKPELTKGSNYIKVNGFALVPLKSISAWIGATVDFDKSSGIIILKFESNIVSLKLKADVASVNGRLVQLQTPATELKGITYVPLRFIGEAFGAKIKLDASNGEIMIEHPSSAAVLVLSMLHPKSVSKPHN